MNSSSTHPWLWKGNASLLWSSLLLVLIGSGLARAAPNEVWHSGGQYHWKVNEVQQGSSTDLATAIQGAIGVGNREVHLRTGGDLTKTVNLAPGLTLRGNGNTLTRSHGGYGFHREGSGGIAIYDLNLEGHGGMWIRTSRASDLTFENLSIKHGAMGIRVDSHPSRPYEEGRWVSNLTVRNCRFEHTGGHALETYGVDGAYIDGIVARHAGGCGVLLNKTRNAFVGSVDAYRCNYGGGYAGLRFANNCSDIRVRYLRAIECGRGFFTVTGARNIVVEEVYIRDCSSHAVLIQNSDVVGINSGTYNGVALNHYTSVNSWVHATSAAGVTTPPLAAAAGLVASFGDGGVDLNWPAVSGATHYLLQRATTHDGHYETIAYLEGTSFTDRAIEGGADYHYVVRAVNRAGPGQASAKASVAIPEAFTPVVDLDAGLHLHYPFDGSSANLQGGPPASIAGTTQYVPGRLNQALAFDGNANHVTLPALSGQNLREFTAAAWILRGSDANWQRVFDFGSGTTNYMMLAFVEGSLGFDISRNGSVQRLRTEAPPMDQWAHVALTFKGNWATLYIDGSARKSILFSNSPGHLDLSRNYLGRSQHPDPLFRGRMDDFRLYTRALEAAEVSALFMKAPPMPPADLSAGGFGARVKLAWAGVENATTYHVKRATKSGGPYTSVATNVTGTTYSDSSVTEGTTYYYVVIAGNSSGESAYSAESVATVSDLVAHLKFDEASGNLASDSSGNDWSASLVNDPSFEPGVLRNALHFSSASSQHATLPTGVVSGLDDFTISTWVRVSSFSTWARIFDFGSGTDNYMFLTPQRSGTSARMRFAIRTPSVNEQGIHSSIALPPDAWAHVAITRSGATARMYLNGELAGANLGMSLSPASLGITSANYLGRSQWPDPYFDGAIDDFRIYSRALDEAELHALANPLPEAPEQVYGLAGDGKAVLSWEAGNAATSYHVKRATAGGGPYIPVAENLTETEFTDTGLSNGVTYFYVILANNHRGQSERSEEVSVSPTRLRVHLKFDEASGSIATDSSGRGQHAELMNGATWSDGRIANAVRLDSAASQYVELPPAVIEGLTNFTLMTWVRPGTVAQWSRIFDFGGATAPSADEGSYMFLTPSNGSVLRFGITTSGFNHEQQISGAVPLPAGVWTHVAVTLAGSSGRLYVNGRQVGVNHSMTLNPASLGAIRRAYLGRSGFASDPYLDGSIDDFRIFHHALGADAIALYAFPLEAPQDLLAVGGPRRVDLSWSPVSYADRYVVRGATSPGGPYVLLASELTGPSFSHTGLDSGKMYHYQVAAINLTGEGPPSAVVGAASSGGLLEEWRQHHFGTPEPIGDAADDADPDGDGLVNLLEYALGSNPLSADPSAGPVLSIQDGQVRFEFHRIADPELVYEAFSSTNLAEWSMIWSSVDEEPGEGSVRLVDSVPISPVVPRFLKLRVSVMRSDS